MLYSSTIHLFILIARSREWRTIEARAMFEGKPALCGVSLLYFYRIQVSCMDLRSSYIPRFFSCFFSTFVYLFGDVAFSEYFFNHCRFLFRLYGEYVVARSFLRMVFFYLVTTRWIFDISLCENSIIKYNNRRLNTNRYGSQSCTHVPRRSRS